MKYLLARLAEPTSWAGLGIAYNSVYHIATTGQTSQPIIAGLIGGLLAVFMPEKGGQAK